MNNDARTSFMHNGTMVALDAGTYAGIVHDTHFNPDSEGHAALVEAALKAEKTTETLRLGG